MNPISPSFNPEATQKLAALLVRLQMDLYMAHPSRTYATLDAARSAAITTQARRLLDEGANPGGGEDAQARSGHSFLAMAADIGSSTLVQTLLDAGADPNQSATDTGMAPLHLACNADIVRLLTQAGAHPNLPDKSGCAPLVYAVGKSNLETMDALLACGSDPNCTNSNGEPVLHVAAVVPERDTLQKLLDAGSNPDATDGKRWNVETRMRRNSLLDDDEQAVRRSMLAAARLGRNMEPAPAGIRRHRL